MALGEGPLALLYGKLEAGDVMHGGAKKTPRKPGRSCFRVDQAKTQATFLLAS